MSSRFCVRVPATSANLGCLFDCAALAYGLYVNVHVTPHAAGETRVSYQGVTPERIPTGEDNLIVRTIRNTLESWGKTRGFDLEIENQIPVGVGLGSSAAAIVAGLAASHVLADRVLLDDELISLAAKIEGHPDNAAAAWLGGFTISTQAGDKVVSLSCPVPDRLKLVLVIPDYPLATEKSRAVLPEHYSRADAVHNLQRGAMIAAKLFSGMSDLNCRLFDDRWHQPYRAPLMPGLSEVLKLRMHGLLGLCLSGAGPSILALTRENGPAIGEAIREILGRSGVNSAVTLLSPDNKGAKGWSLPG